MKSIKPEHGSLNQTSVAPSCRNVQIIPIQRKCGAGAERVRGEYWQIDNMKHICQLYAPNCQISNNSRIVIN